MAEKDNPGPSLELPSLFDRKKKRRSSGDDTASSPGPAPAAQAAHPTPASDAAPAADGQDTRVLDPAPAPAPAPAPSTPTQAAPPPPSARPEPSTGQAGEDSDDEAGTGAGAGRTLPNLPELGAAVAALVVGALVGLLGVVLTFLGLTGCELVTGTDSCGGPGLLVLVAIVVAMVLAGAAALRLFRVPDAGSVSFLGVGLLVVVVLVLLIDALDSAVMLVVIPALTAACFAAARWVTTQLSDDVMADR